MRARVSEKATVGVVFTAAVFMSALDSTFSVRLGKTIITIRRKKKK